MGGFRDETMWLLMGGVHLALLVRKLTYTPFDSGRRLAREGEGRGKGCDACNLLPATLGDLDP
jgi:hypothetical protein